MAGCAGRIIGTIGMIDAPTTKEQAKARRYGEWKGQPNGVPFHDKGCAYEVYHATKWRFHQCSRVPGHGPASLYCKQHAKRVPAVAEASTL